MRFKLITLLFAVLTAQADTVAYVATQTGGFGTMDLNTGAFTFVQNSPYAVDGLGALNGSIYASTKSVATEHGTLFSVNPTNGALNAIGSDTGLIYQTFGSTTSGLYAVGYDPKAAKFSENLYSINPLTGAATLVGALGLGLPDYQALSANASVLYFAFDNSLYTLNTGTGAATLVGGFGGSTEVGALLMEGGTLYGADNYHNTIDTINLSTGVASIGPSSTVFSGNYGYTFGLAPLSTATSTTPEPGSLAEIALGFCIIGAMLRRWVG